MNYALEDDVNEEKGRVNYLIDLIYNKCTRVPISPYLGCPV